MSTIKNYGVPLDQESIQGYAQELTGWAYYIDNEHDINNPFVVNETQKLVIPNNAANVLKEQIPVGTDPLYDGVANKVTPDSSGDAYLLRIGFKRFTSSNTGYGEITLDIGQAEPILEAPVNFPRGSGAINASSFVVTELVFSGNDFVGNGGSLYYESVRGNTSIYDIRYLIARVHKAR